MNNLRFLVSALCLASFCGANGQCSFNLQMQTELACPFAFDGTVTANVTGGNGPFTYQWGIDTVFSNQLTGLDVGTYAVTVTDANGCSEVAQAVLEAVQRPDVSATTVGVSCFGVSDGSVSFLTADNTLTFSLLGSDFSSQNVYESLGSGGYQYFFRDTSGCEWLQFFDISTPPKIIVEMPTSLTSERCDSVQIEPVLNVEDASFTWSPDTYLSCTDCPDPMVENPFTTTTYRLTVVDSNGCTATDSVEVRVEFEERAHIPNAFSPNGDNLNDSFFVLGNCVEEVRLLRIFDRWGKEVFTSKNGPPRDPTAGWDGKLKGEEAASDVYIYKVIVLLGDGTEKEYKGDLTLLR
jgi:gliding motility-associated-like protein